MDAHGVWICIPRMQWRLMNLLEDAKYEVHVVKTDKANTENLEKIEKSAADLNLGLIVGVGGGTKIDLAKKTAYVAIGNLSNCLRPFKCHFFPVSELRRFLPRI